MHASYQRTDNPYFSSVYDGKQPNLPITTRRLLVDYRDREGGGPFDFVVHFGKNGVTSYEHVTSVEMKMLALPCSSRMVPPSVDAWTCFECPVTAPR